MNPIQVWAPKAKTVELHKKSGKYPMEPSKNGWWYSQKKLVHGDDYGFIIDGRGPFPDPRSRWQPDGPHSLSRVFEFNYPWLDQEWKGIESKQTVIYELHVGTFTEEGTFEAIGLRIPHLKELGITHIELLPIAGFSGNHGWGYDGVNIFAPHANYGSPEDLMALVNLCHQNNLGVILDVVYNHLGPDGNYLSHFGPYFHNHSQTPWGEAINFDSFDSPEVRNFFIDNALMWLNDFHLDGLRLDAVQTIIDGSAIHFLEELGTKVAELQKQNNRFILLIAESHMNDSRLMLRQDRGGYGLHCQWHDDFHHAIYSYLTEENAGYFQDYGSLEQIAKVFNEGVYFDGNYCQYRQRYLGRPATGLSGINFIAYIQNHDQVGNRPGGERLSHVLTSGQMKIAATLLLTSPFIPMLFQGEEWGATSPFFYFTDHKDSQLGKAIKRGRKKEAEEFGWPLTHFSDPQLVDSFERSHLDWNELTTPQNNELLQWYKQLLILRKHHTELQGGNFLMGAATVDNNRQVLLIRRENFSILFNFSNTKQTFEWHSDNSEIILQSDKLCTILDKQIQLVAHSVVILHEKSKGN